MASFTITTPSEHDWAIAASRDAYNQSAPEDAQLATDKDWVDHILQVAVEQAATRFTDPNTLISQRVTDLETENAQLASRAAENDAMARTISNLQAENAALKAAAE